jgi:hypothetical protein
MTTKLACLQDFTKRDAGDITARLKKKEGHTSRDWVIAFSINKTEKGLLGKPFSGKVRENFPLAIARVDFGRWIADCPFCGSACMVDPDDPFFFCLYCAGLGTGDACPCKFPENRDEIETEILKRQVISIGKHTSRADAAKNEPPLYYGLARNWTPEETVDDLRKQRQNIEKLYEKAAH